MTLRLKPVAAAVVAACFVSAPVLAASYNSAHKHRTFRPAGAKRQAAISLMKPYDQFAFDVINKNSTKGGPGFVIGRHGKSGPWLQVSGLMNLDAKLSNRTPLFAGASFEDKEASDLYVNNANILFDGAVNHCLKYHIGLAYVNDSTYGAGTASTTVRDGALGFLDGNLSVDEAYVVLSNFAKTPFYLKAGKMFADFGQYSSPYPLTYSLPQLLAQTRGTGAQVGLVTGYGFYGSAAVLSGYQSRQRSSDADKTKLNNFTAKAGYQGQFQGYDINANVSYLHDLRDGQYLDTLLTGYATGLAALNHRRTSAIAVHGGVGFGSKVGRYYDHTFNVSGDWVGATRKLVQGQSSDIGAWGLDGAYAFRLYHHDSQVHLGYSRSNNAYFTHAGLDTSAPLLPKWRLMVDYSYHLLPYTKVQVMYYHDKQDSRFSAPSGDKNSSDTVAARLSVAI